MTAPTIPARPTIYNGVQMRSRLEARYAAWLDSQSIVWEYEPRCFASEHGQYLPDFAVRNVDFMGTPCDVYIEVKPTEMFLDDATNLLERQESIWNSEPDALAITFAIQRSWTEY